MVVAAKHKFYSELTERVRSLLRVGQRGAAGDRALYWVVVRHDYSEENRNLSRRVFLGGFRRHS